MDFRKLQEFEAEVGTRGDIDGLKDTLGFGAVDDLELSGIVTRNCTEAHLFVYACTDVGHHVSKIGDVVKTTAQVTPNWFDLSNAEEDGVHESDDVKGHLLGGESAKSKCFDLLCDHVGLVHEARTTGPTKGRFSTTHPTMTVNLPYNSTYEAKIFTPTFGRPTIVECFEGDLRF